MQTFLPFSSFVESAEVLDRQRLGKQRVETLQIMSALTHLHIINPTAPAAEWRLEGWESRWGNHAVTRMWRGYEGALLRYQRAVCDEWTSRGYRDTCMAKTALLYATWFGCDDAEVNAAQDRPPKWLGDPALHEAYRATLIRKDKRYREVLPRTNEHLRLVYPNGLRDPRSA